MAGMRWMAFVALLAGCGSTDVNSPVYVVSDAGGDSGGGLKPVGEQELGDECDPERPHCGALAASLAHMADDQRPAFGCAEYAGQQAPRCYAEACQNIEGQRFCSQLGGTCMASFVCIKGR